jgi:hypothetical protein
MIYKRGYKGVLNMFIDRCLDAKESFEGVFSWFRCHFVNICGDLVKISIATLVAFLLYNTGYKNGIKDIQMEMARLGVAEYVCDPVSGEVAWVVTLKPSTE